jgi:diamine N-acetyltransferase
MNFSVYLRPLQVEDAQISYKWRNNPEIWKQTGSKPDKYITPEMEAEWITNVLQRENEKRFAICLKENNQYIGNIFFTDITKTDAHIHIFIGESALWGKKIAFEAICQIGIYGFQQLQLQTIYALVTEENMASNALAQNFGAAQLQEYFDEAENRTIRKWVFTRQMYEFYYQFLFGTAPAKAEHQAH